MIRRLYLGKVKCFQLHQVGKLGPPCDGPVYCLYAWYISLEKHDGVQPLTTSFAGKLLRGRMMFVLHDGRTDTI